MPREGSKRPLLGILALQGGFEAHFHALEKLAIPALLIRTSKDLKACDGLILPGGESTTMTRLLGDISLKEYQKPIFGTCAGLILMAKSSLMPLGIERNAYGRQSASFATSLPFMGKNIQALFIRAPRIIHVAKEVSTLSYHKGDPVLVQYGKYLGATFHPELTEDLTLHRYFINSFFQEMD